MDELQEARKVIDRADEELTRLFEERFEAVRRIVAYKRAHGLPVLDSGREAVILEANRKRLADKAFDSYFEAWYREMLKQSRRFQEDLLAEDAEGQTGQS